LSTASVVSRYLGGNLRRLLVVGAALVVALALAASAAHAQALAAGASASPASAALSTDGTSNTIQFFALSVVVDQAHHRAIVNAPAADGLKPGMRFATVRVITPQLKYTFTDVMVESIAAADSISLNFTKVE